MTAEVGSIMINSLPHLFGTQREVTDLPFLARDARQAADSWVSVEHQHRWLVFGRALQDWKRDQPVKRGRKSALLANTDLWETLECMCDPVERMLNDLFEGDHGLVCVHVCVRACVCACVHVHMNVCVCAYGICVHQCLCQKTLNPKSVCLLVSGSGCNPAQCKLEPQCHCLEQAHGMLLCRWMS